MIVRPKNHTEDDAFEAGKPLTPDQIYFAAIGMFNAAGFTCKCIVTKKTEPFEYARVFAKGDARHVLYYPGKDGDANPVNLDDTIFGIAQSANAAISSFLNISQSDLDDYNKHYVLVDSQMEGHYVYCYSGRRSVTKYNSLFAQQAMSMPYDNPGLDRLHPRSLHIQRPRPRYSQSETELWESGHVILETHLFTISKIDYQFGEEPSALLERHRESYLSGKKLARGCYSELCCEGVAALPPKKNPRKVFNYTFYDVMKSILTGLLLGMAIAGVIAICVYTFGGAAALFGFGAFIGGACGFTGAGSVLFGLGVIASAVVLATTAISAIRKYFKSRRFFRSTEPSWMDSVESPDAMNGVVMQQLGVTAGTVNQVGNDGLPPPPPYTDEMATEWLEKQSNIKDNTEAPASSATRRLE